MARLTSITSKNQVAAEHHPIVDAIVKSRGAVQGPFTMLLHCPPLASCVMQLGAYVRFEGKLDKRVRVLAAMTAARLLSERLMGNCATNGSKESSRVYNFR